MDDTKHGATRHRRRSRWALAAAAVLLAACAAPPTREAQVERGRYLAESIMACGNCHTPKDSRGQPIAAQNLSGGNIRISPPPFSVVPPNITPDRDTGIGRWTDAEIKRSIVAGERPAHHRLAGQPLAVMAAPYFKALLPEDLDALVAYLRTVKPVHNESPVPVYRAPIRHQPYPDAERGFTAAQMSDPVERGRYLVTIGHCMECHTPFNPASGFDYKRLGAGGRVFDAKLVQGLGADWAGSVARNITSHRTAGIGAWSDAEIKRAITQGISRNGRKLGRPMGYEYYAKMTEADLDAIVAYLRTLPPVE